MLFLPGMFADGRDILDRELQVEVQCSTPVPASRGDGKELEINVTAPGGFADTAAQE